MERVSNINTVIGTIVFIVAVVWFFKLFDRGNKMSKKASENISLNKRFPRSTAENYGIFTSLFVIVKMIVLVIVALVILNLLGS